MAGINAGGTAVPQQSPARGYNSRLVLSSQCRRSEVPCEGGAFVEQQRHAVIGMSRRVQDSPTMPIWPSTVRLSAKEIVTLSCIAMSRY